MYIWKISKNLGGQTQPLISLNCEELDINGHFLIFLILFDHDRESSISSHYTLYLCDGQFIFRPFINILIFLKYTT